MELSSGLDITEHKNSELESKPIAFNSDLIKDMLDPYGIC